MMTTSSYPAQVTPASTPVRLPVNVATSRKFTPPASVLQTTPLRAPCILPLPETLSSRATAAVPITTASNAVTAAFATTPAPCITATQQSTLWTKPTIAIPPVGLPGKPACVSGAPVADGATHLSPAPQTVHVGPNTKMGRVAGPAPQCTTTVADARPVGGGHPRANAIESHTGPDSRVRPLGGTVTTANGMLPAAADGSIGPLGGTVTKVQFHNRDSYLAKYRFDGDFQVNEQPIVLQRADNCRDGGNIWDGGIVLAKYLEQFVAPKYPPKACALELGSGTGIGGIAWEMCGHTTIFSDVEDVVPNLAENVRRNKLTSTIEVLDWTNITKDPPNVDVVFASDVMWHKGIIKPFIQTLNWVAQPSTEIIVAQTTRVQDFSDVIISEASLVGLTCTRTQSKDIPNFAFPHPNVQIWTFAKTA